MNKKEIIANLIFPDVTKDIAYLEKKYPPRKLKSTALVTRFAPSPTGFLHTGSLFTSLVSWRFAKQSQGVFYGRLEDTDTKREIAGSGNELAEQLTTFGINFDESYIKPGKYGPYVQSERKWIYDIVIKEFILRDLAYPCFMTMDELNQLRAEQDEQKVNPGYYGKYARDRHLDDDTVIEKLKSKVPYVIRFKSQGDPDKKIKVTDLVKGELELPENNLDIVIMKADGLPTYHFAHLVDDHFMRTTHVTRGEEWLSSLPIHIQLFDAIGFQRVQYAHLPVIMKLDDDTKQRRKLSKRKDPEAAVSYFLEQGYDPKPFLKYLMTIVNSNYEEWLINNHNKDMFDFEISFDKMNIDGALFDIEKVKYFSKEYLSSLTGEEFTKKAKLWAQQYNKELLDFIACDEKQFRSVISIERGGEKPRKDYASFSEIIPLVGFISDKYYYDNLSAKLVFNPKFDNRTIKAVLSSYVANHGLDLSTENDWFTNLKVLGERLGFAPNKQTLKQNPDKYKYLVGELAEVLRIAICGKASTPNFYLVQKILTPTKVIERINKVISFLN